MSSSDSIDELKMFGLQMRAYSSVMDFYRRNDKGTTKCYDIFMAKFSKKYPNNSAIEPFWFLRDLNWRTVTSVLEDQMMTACLNCTNVNQLNDIIYCFGVQNIQ